MDKFFVLPPGKPRFKKFAIVLLNYEPLMGSTYGYVRIHMMESSLEVSSKIPADVYFTNARTSLSYNVYNEE